MFIGDFYPRNSSAGSVPRRSNRSMPSSNCESKCIARYTQDRPPLSRAAVSTTATRSATPSPDALRSGWLHKSPALANDDRSGTLSASRCTRIVVVSLSEQPAAWSRTVNALTDVSVRSRYSSNSALRPVEQVCEHLCTRYATTSSFLNLRELDSVISTEPPPDFVSSEFERLCQQMLPELYAEETFIDIGRWWYKEHEGDMVDFTTERGMVVGE